MFATIGAALQAAGYTVTPTRGKAAFRPQWQKGDALPPAAFIHHAECNVGLVLGVAPWFVVALDIDSADAAFAERCEALALELLGCAPVRVGSWPKRLLLYRLSGPHAKLKRGALEVLCTGQQCVVYGTHPDTGREYEWTDLLGGLKEWAPGELTLVEWSAVEAWVAACTAEKEEPGEPGSKGLGGLNENRAPDTRGETGDPMTDYAPPLGLSIDEARALLEYAGDPAALDYDEWLKVGMALHHEGGGADEWKALWDEWCGDSPKFVQETGDYKWESFGKRSGRPVTLKWLVALANAAKAETEPQRAALSDFEAYLPEHKYIYLPTGALWPAESVNASVAPWPQGGNGKDQAPSKWLDAHRPVVQMTWAPGEGVIVQGRLLDAGGWKEYPGVRLFNQYKGPVIADGDSRAAGRWRDHLRLVYPETGVAEHIERWFAQRLQQPQVKVNHALVLGGSQGVGKDTLCEPLKHGVGPWNWSEISPSQLVGAFNRWRQSVVVRVSEIHDLGETSRFAFYEATKTLSAAPPDVLSVNDKYRAEYAVLNVLGLLMTTNHKLDGIYLPPDDRRHFVAWSDLDKGTLDEGFWPSFWAWLEAGGVRAVVAFLRGLSLAGWDAKAPPPQTDAWHQIVGAGAAPESAELEDAIDALGRPAVLTLEALRASVALSMDSSLAGELGDVRKRRQWAHRLDAAGYERLRNPFAGSGLWVIGKSRQVVYVRKNLSNDEKLRLMNGAAKEILEK